VSYRDSLSETARPAYDKAWAQAEAVFATAVRDLRDRAEAGDQDAARRAAVITQAVRQRQAREAVAA
jgi:hypothetical protein